MLHRPIQEPLQCPARPLGQLPPRKVAPSTARRTSPTSTSTTTAGMAPGKVRARSGHPTAKSKENIMNVSTPRPQKAKRLIARIPLLSTHGPSNQKKSRTLPMSKKGTPRIRCVIPIRNPGMSSLPAITRERQRICAPFRRAAPQATRRPSKDATHDGRAAVQVTPGAMSLVKVQAKPGNLGDTIQRVSG